MKEHGFARGTESLGGGGYAAQNTVFITDCLLCQALHTIPLILPFNNFPVIFFPGIKIAKGGMFCPFYDGVLYGGNRSIVHIRYPHGNFGKTIRYLGIVKGDDIHGDGILSLSVNNGCKVVFHGIVSFVWGFFLCNQFTIPGEDIQWGVLGRVQRRGNKYILYIPINILFHFT